MRGRDVEKRKGKKKGVRYNKRDEDRNQKQLIYIGKGKLQIKTAYKQRTAEMKSGVKWKQIKVSKK